MYRSQIERTVQRGDVRSTTLLLRNIGQASLRIFAVSLTPNIRSERTYTDKMHAVLALLNDAEWVKWSDNEIARRCAVSQPFVSKIRPTYHGFKIERTVYRRTPRT